MPKALIYDFDKTLVTEHLTQTVLDPLFAFADPAPTEKDITDLVQQKFASGELHVNECMGTCALFADAIEHGDCIAICSRTPYPAAIHAVLDYMVAYGYLSQTTREQIIVIAIEADTSEGKIPHIEAAIAQFASIDGICVVDDEATNLDARALNRLGLSYETVFVTADQPDFTTAALQRLDKLRKENQQDFQTPYRASTPPPAIATTTSAPVTSKKTKPTSYSPPSPPTPPTPRGATNPVQRKLF